MKLVKEREVYGAFILGDEPEILTAEAASPAVAQQLSGIGTQMQQKIDGQVISGLQKGNEKMQEEMEKALTAAASGRSPPQGNPADQVDGPDASAMEVPQVTVTDVVPLSDDDASGAGLAIAGLPLTIGGIVGGVLTSMGIRSRRMRAVATLVYGPAGIAIGAVLTMFIGNPIASLNQPEEFLVGAWGDIGQFFVPGAAGTLLRDLSYFPDAAVGLQWWVLIAWFVVGIALILIGHLLAHRRTTTSAH